MRSYLRGFVVPYTACIVASQYRYSLRSPRSLPSVEKGNLYCFASAVRGVVSAPVGWGVGLVCMGLRLETL